jgi:O-antigen ligase
MVMVFRVLPGIESRFLHSFIARIFISSNVLDLLFTDGTKNNVLDPTKAGGVFVNANIASVFLGFCAIVSWHSAKQSGSALERSVAVLDWIAVFFTGSKAGAALAVAVPLALSFIRLRRLSPALIITLCVSCGLVSIALVLFWDMLMRYQHVSEDTLGTRVIIWNFATMMLQEHPIFGLGFGGWDLDFPFYAANHGISKSFPAHNSLLIAWSQSGIAAVLAGVWWMGAVYAALLRGFKLGHGERNLALGIAGAFTWYLAEGFGENMGLLGEVHLTPMLGALLGHLCARCDARETVNERIPETPRGVAPTSAIQAV